MSFALAFFLLLNPNRHRQHANHAIQRHTGGHGKVTRHAVWPKVVELDPQLIATGQRTGWKAQAAMIPGSLAGEPRAGGREPSTGLRVALRHGRAIGPAQEERRCVVRLNRCIGPPLQRNWKHISSLHGRSVRQMHALQGDGVAEDEISGQPGSEEG